MAKLIDDDLLDLLGAYYIQQHQQRVPDESFGDFADRMMLGRNSYGFLNPTLMNLRLTLVVLLAQKGDT